MKNPSQEARIGSRRLWALLDEMTRAGRAPTGRQFKNRSPLLIASAGRAALKSSRTPPQVPVQQAVFCSFGNPTRSTPSTLLASLGFLPHLAPGFGRQRLFSSNAVPELHRRAPFGGLAPLLCLVDLAGERRQPFGCHRSVMAGLGTSLVLLALQWDAQVRPILF